MDEVRNDGRSPDAKTHCDLYLGGRGRRASRPPKKNSVNFKNIKETTDQNATAHCSVPMLKNVQAMRRAHLLDGAVPS